MKPTEIASALNARVCCAGTFPECDVQHAYAGDRISDLIGHASPETLLVTNIANTQLIRVAELVGVGAICLVGGVEPSPELLSTAQATGTVVLVSPAGLFETCGLLYPLMGGGR